MNYNSCREIFVINIFDLFPYWIAFKMQSLRSPFKHRALFYFDNCYLYFPFTFVCYPLLMQFFLKTRLNFIFLIKFFVAPHLPSSWLQFHQLKIAHFSHCFLICLQNVCKLFPRFSFTRPFHHPFFLFDHPTSVDQKYQPYECCFTSFLHQADLFQIYPPKLFSPSQPTWPKSTTNRPTGHLPAFLSVLVDFCRCAALSFHHQLNPSRRLLIFCAPVLSTYSAHVPRFSLSLYSLTSQPPHLFINKNTK